MGNEPVDPAVDEQFRRILERLDEQETLEQLRARFAPIFAAYERAVQDPQTKLPSYLMAAIEAARR